MGIMSDRALAFVSIIFGHTGRRGRPHKFSLSSNLGRGWVVEAVRATLGSFGSDSSKSTKFGPDIPYTIPFRFFEGVKKSDTRGRHIGKIQYGRQSFQPQVVFKQPKGVKNDV